MDFLSTIVKERRKGFFGGGSKKNPAPSELDIVPYPYPYPRQNNKPLASQWSPVSVTFDTKPHVLLKRSKSMKSISQRRSKFEDDDTDDSLSPNDRRSKVLNVIIFPLTRRKSKTSLHKSPEVSPSSSETSSISDRIRPSPVTHRPSPITHRPNPITHRPSPITPRPSPVTHRRTASHGAPKDRSLHGEHNRAPEVPPLPTNVPPVPKLPGRVAPRRPMRPRTADSASATRSLHTQPAAADVEGYWDHISLFANSYPVPPLPRAKRPPPVPF